MQPSGRRWFFGFIAVCLLYIIICGIGIHVTPNATAAMRQENAAWVASGKSWLDRQMCRWFELCGTYHMIHTSGWTWQKATDDIPGNVPSFNRFWTSGEEDPDSWSPEELERRKIPNYVLDHAPYVHLFSREKFWPSDIAEHLIHITPYLNYTEIDTLDVERNLTNLHDLNNLPEGRHGRFVYLQSIDNVEERPSWLTSEHNIPVAADPPNGDVIEAPWPGDSNDQGPMMIDAAALVDQAIGEQAFPWPAWPTADLELSTNGRCGGNSGFTCKGSKFGECCSIHGWCGKSGEFCMVDYCDPLHGDCINPLYPPPGPKQDLKKRELELPLEPIRNLPATSSIGRSNAPAILVVADKGNGTVDAFWFFFYSFNLGQKVFNIRFGNHVGDWEHTCVRFKDGKPESVFFSEHDFGDAYAWHAVEKYLPSADGHGTMLSTLSNRTASKAAKRPVVYSAVGSHAMYATPGVHPYVLPWGLLHDQTDRGPLWDPALNVKAFTYDMKDKTARASTLNPKAPTSWFNYAGHWGDKYYPLSDPRQYRFAGQYHYVNGPTGPKFKRLGREHVCQNKGICHIKHWLGGNRAKRLQPVDGDEEGGLPGGNSTDDAS